MSFIEISLQRRPHGKQTHVPQFELLEERQCLSVAAPTGLQAVALSTTQAKLTWNNVPSATGFNINEWNGTQSTMISSVGKGITTFTVKNLQANTAYYFSVTAHDAATSATSAWVPISTPADAIQAPIGVHITAITQNSMTIQWTNAAGATGYNVYGWNGSHAFLLGSTTPANPSFKVNNLSLGTTYYFYVQSVNNTNNAVSNWVSATTLSSGITAPTNFKAQGVNASTIGLSWNNVLTANGYRVYMWDGNANDSPVVIATLAKNTTGYQAVGLLPGTNYWFYVQAFNANNVANTAWVKATTIAATPLAPPTNVTAVITGPNSVKISWIEPARAVGYEVFVWNGSGWTEATAVTAGVHTALITGLASNTTQWFYVAAFTTNFAEISYSTAVFANL